MPIEDLSVQIVFEISGYELSVPFTENETSSYVAVASSTENCDQEDSSVVCLGEHYPCGCMCHVMMIRLESTEVPCEDCDCLGIHQNKTPVVIGPDPNDTFMDELDELSVEVEDNVA